MWCFPNKAKSPDFPMPKLWNVQRYAKTLEPSLGWGSDHPSRNPVKLKHNKFEINFFAILTTLYSEFFFYYFFGFSILHGFYSTNRERDSFFLLILLFSQFVRIFFLLLPDHFFHAQYQCIFLFILLKIEPILNALIYIYVWNNLSAKVKNFPNSCQFPI